MRFEGDAFFVVFPNIMNAAHWCVQAQLDLLSVMWPEELLKHPRFVLVEHIGMDDHFLLSIYSASEEKADGKIIFRGLRVRMGFHIGDSSPQINSVTKRMDYFGTSVNKAARIAGIYLLT